MWEAKGGGSVNTKAVGEATGGALVHTAARKATGVLYAGWLGDTEGTSGEPTLGGRPGDPTTGWGVNGIVAAGANALEIGLMLFGVEPKGYAGAAVDGMVQGGADASLYIFAFKFMNAYAIGKKSTGGGAVAGDFNYDKRRKELQARQEQRQPPQRSARVENAIRTARNDPYAGYR